MSSALGEPLATDLLGTWACRPRNGDASFTWVVDDRLPGGWLVGEGHEDGRPTSLETWAFTPDERLTERRQFTARGAFVRLSVVARGADSLSSEGEVTFRDGTRFPVRHRLRMIEAGRFEATWEADEGGGWTTVADEVCTRDAG